MRDFRKLDFWQRSHKLALSVYKYSRLFPKEETFGIISQIRRCALSIPSNIAEGCGRNSIIELKRFLAIASGSASELQYQLILSFDLGYLTESVYKELYSEIIYIQKMIFLYSKKLIDNS
jgi:four helix bundle protein